MTIKAQLVYDSIYNKYYHDLPPELKHTRTPVLCGSFVLRCLGNKPEAIAATISDEPLEGALRVFVSKGGYYRWNWRVTDWPIVLSSSCSGMFNEAENILNKMFPDTRSDNLDPERNVWVLLQTN